MRTDAATCALSFVKNIVCDAVSTSSPVLSVGNKCNEISAEFASPIGPDECIHRGFDVGDFQEPAALALEYLCRSRKFWCLQIRESLCLATPIRGRLPRIRPTTGWTYACHHIPAGVTVSSSSYLMHHNEDVLPSPDILNPERWLSTDEAALKLHERHFVPFSKGARGIDLNRAQAEVNIALATMVRRFRVVEVVDTELVTSEMFATMLPKGQRVIVQRVED